MNLPFFPQGSVYNFGPFLLANTQEIGLRKFPSKLLKSVRKLYLEGLCGGHPKFDFVVPISFLQLIYKFA